MLDMNKDKIIVALSGGVDSAMAVVILQKLGFEVIGVHFVFDSKRKSEQRVEKIAKQLGIELIVEDVSSRFKKMVVDDFVAKYENGQTPNPCVICNPEVKFKELLKMADEMGIEKVATGHYALVELSGENSVGGCMGEPKDIFSLHRAKDLTKDQSYFLYRLGQGELSRIIFPLYRFACSRSMNLAMQVAMMATN